MRFLSICSGIEAASVAWEPLGWQAIGYAEIEPFPAAVLHHRFGASRPVNMPDPCEEGISTEVSRARHAAIKAVSKIPATYNGPVNHGDFTQIKTETLGRVDLLVGGTPCQAFSLAGKRLSLADARGNLSLAYTVLAHELFQNNGLRWAVYENVPGILSTKDNAFGCLLAGLVGADDPLCLPRGAERWPDEGMVEGPRARAAWRILDAQYFGLAQRRRRVFVVVGFGDGADPAAVLFERQGLRRHPPSRGEAGEGVAGTIDASAGRSRGAGINPGMLAAYGGGNRSGSVEVAACLVAKGQKCDFEVETFIAHSLRGEGFDASEDGTGRGTPLVPVCFDPRQTDVLVHGDISAPLDTKFPGPAIAFDCKAGGDTSFSVSTDVFGALRGVGHGGGHSAVSTAWAVRRLTPTECHRLQGFADDHAAIPGAADGPIYKSLGNSMATRVMAWIGQKIDAFERWKKEDAA